MKFDHLLGHEDIANPLDITEIIFFKNHAQNVTE